MLEPFIGEIHMISFPFAPQGWALCDGQTLPINQNQALFSILGTRYGGNGQTTFALPDLRGRSPMHWGGSIPLGQKGGEEQHTLTRNEMPPHVHPVFASGSAANQVSPAGNLWGATTTLAYGPATSLVSMSPTAISTAGGGQPHPNMPPYLVLNFVIALQGIFPSQS